MKIIKEDESVNGDWKEYRKKETIKACESGESMTIKINFDRQTKKKDYLCLESLDENHYSCLRKEFLNQYKLIPTISETAEIELQLEKLARFLIYNFNDSVIKNKSPVDVAIELLKKYTKILEDMAE